MNWVALQTLVLFHGNFKEVTDKLYCSGPLSEGILEIFSVSSMVHLSFLSLSFCLYFSAENVQICYT